MGDDDDNNRNINIKLDRSQITTTNTAAITATNTYTATVTTNTSLPSTTILLCNAAASACASIVSRLCTHPFDTIKARIQIFNTNSNNNRPSNVTCTTHSNFYSSGPNTKVPVPPSQQQSNALWNRIVGQGSYWNGIKSLYRGLGVVIIGGTPGTMLYLCTYDIMKQQLSNVTKNNDTTSTGSSNPKNNQSYNFLIHFASGMIAETIACMVYVPVDVIKERMQVQQLPQSADVASTLPHATHHMNHYYRNTNDAIRQILQTEGIRGIYRGYAATLASFGPFSALYFVFYEYFKNYIHTSYHPSPASSSGSDTRSSHYYVDIPFHWTVVCAATAGGLASFLTSPLDMAKLRLQVQRGSNSMNQYHIKATSTTPEIQYTGMMDCLQKVYRQNGIPGLFRGAGARVLHFAPATTVTMTTYETLRQQFESYLIQHG